MKAVNLLWREVQPMYTTRKLLLVVAAGDTLIIQNVTHALHYTHTHLMISLTTNRK